MEKEKLTAAFERFLDTGACRDMERELRDLVHAAFVSGWCAARCADNQPKETKQPR